jgi:hypothetical protein
VTVPLTLEGDGGNWRLVLNGDWTLAAIGRHPRSAQDLAATLEGTLTCDWSGAQAPGIACTWALLTRLAELNRGGLAIRHSGDPPHFLEFLQRLQAEQAAAPGTGAQPHPRNFAELLAEVGHWAMRQGWGRARRGRVLRPHRCRFRADVFPAAGAAHLVAGPPYLRNRDHSDTDRRADRISDQRDRRLSRGAAAEAIRRRDLRRRSRDDRGAAGIGRAA